MNKQQYDTLVQVFNALYKIRTQGDDTLVMADVLVALRQMLETTIVNVEEADMKEPVEK